MLGIFHLTRGIHRLIIAVIFFMMVFLLATGVYYAFIKPAPTCTDGIQNQDEQGIDCGGICTNACIEQVTGEPIRIEEAAYVPGGPGRFDVVARLYNPNDQAGASELTYVLALKDGQGNVLASRTGTSYILPQEHKYVLELNLETSGQPSVVSVQIKDVNWAHFTGYHEHPNVNIYQKRYTQISGGAGFSEADGLLSNESPYDFRSIIIRVVLRDHDNKVLAVNSTQMNTVASHEERDFRLVWPNSFPGNVEKVEMEVDADAYHSENFIREFLPGGKFQEFKAPAPF